MIAAVTAGRACLLLGCLVSIACARTAPGAPSSSTEASAMTDAAPRAPNVGRTIDGYTYTDAPVEARLGPHRFRIPANYFRDQMGPDFQGNFHLLVQWPDLQPLLPGERSGQDMATFGRQITIAPAYVDRVPIETLMEASTVPIAPPGSPSLNDPRERLDLMLAQPERHGLIPYEVDVERLSRFAREESARGIQRRTTRETYQDWFVRRSHDGKLVTLIKCNHEPEPGDIRRPGCMHEFTIPELKIAVSMDYRREYLSGWKRIEDRARALIAQYRVD